MNNSILDELQKKEECYKYNKKANSLPPISNILQNKIKLFLHPES